MHLFDPAADVPLTERGQLLRSGKNVVERVRRSGGEV